MSRMYSISDHRVNFDLTFFSEKQPKSKPSLTLVENFGLQQSDPACKRASHAVKIPHEH